MRIRPKILACPRERRPRLASSKKSVKIVMRSSFVPFTPKSSKKLLKKVFFRKEVTIHLKTRTKEVLGVKKIAPDCRSSRLFFSFNFCQASFRFSRLGGSTSPCLLVENNGGGQQRVNKFFPADLYAPVKLQRPF